MYSIIDAVLPRGYGFCIMDDNGKVWFHNDKHRNLMENFIEECDFNPTLKAAIYSNTPRFLDLKYYNSLHQAYILPMKNMPLYLVTFYEFEGEKSFQLQAFTMTFFFFSVLLLLLFLQVLTFFAMKMKLYRSFKKHILIEIIRPKKPDTLRYIKSVHINIMITLLLLVFLHFTVGMYKIFMIYFATSTAFTFSYLFLNHHQTILIRKKVLARIALGVFVLVNGLLLLFTIENNSNYWDFAVVLVFELLLMAVVFIFYQRVVLNRDYNLFILRIYKKNYVRYYTNYIITNLFLIGVIPILVFYQVSYTEEVKIRVKHNQYDLAQKIETHTESQIKNYKGIKLKDADVPTNRADLGIYSKHSFNTEYLSSVPDSVIKLADTGNVSWNNLISSIRPLYDDYSKENKFLSQNNTHNKVYGWKLEKNNNRLSLYYKTNTIALRNSTAVTGHPRYRSITSILPSFSFLRLADNSQLSWVGKVTFNTIFWLVLALILWATWILILRGTNRVFAIQIIDSFVPVAFGKHLAHLIKSRKHIGLLSSSPLDIEDLSRFVDKETDTVWLKLEHLNNHQKLLDIFNEDKNQPGATDTKRYKKALLVHPFDAFFLDKDNNKSLLELLNKVNETNNQIILVMYKRPSELVNMLNESLKEKENEPIENQNYRWRFFFDLFSITEIPLEYNDGTNSIPSLDVSNLKLPPSSRGYYRQLSHYIVKECSAANHLKQFTELLWEYIYPLTDGNDLATAKDWTTKKLMELSMAYYKDIFRALSPVEKFVLYDLASNSVMNPNTYTIITELLKQGYLVKDNDKIQIMNQSFQLFILSTFTKNDAKQLVKAESGGSWAGYKIPLILIIVAIFVMIGLGNQQFMADLNKFLLVIGAGLTSVTTVVGVVSRTKKMTSSTPS